MGRIERHVQTFWRGVIVPFCVRYGFDRRFYKKINLCSGPILLDEYWNIDVSPVADIVIDLGKKNLPFADNSMKTVVCISAINYFSYKRAGEIIKEVYRVLTEGGIARFGTQDLRMIAEKYIANDRNFFFQKLKDGRERFAGETLGDKVNSWFYGYEVYGGRPCRYFYDFESLSVLFRKAGFKTIQRKAHRESIIPEIDLIDNREDQMFFLEVVK